MSRPLPTHLQLTSLADYGGRCGRATDHDHPGHEYYTWATRIRLLSAIEEHRATLTDGLTTLFDQAATC